MTKLLSKEIIQFWPRRNPECKKTEILKTWRFQGLINSSALNIICVLLNQWSGKERNKCTGNDKYKETQLGLLIAIVKLSFFD